MKVKRTTFYIGSPQFKPLWHSLNSVVRKIPVELFWYYTKKSKGSVAEKADREE